MIKANGEPQFLPLYEALASEVRWEIMDIIADREMNVKDIAAVLELSPSIVTMHIRKLEDAGLIGSRRVRINGGTHKLCYLKQNQIEIELPSASQTSRTREQTIAVGHYTAFDIHPTCGLGTLEKEIGVWDDPRYFLDPERVHAAILWFGKGYVEYKTPNFVLPDQTTDAIEISMELASEAPGLRDHWPSDIRFTFNGISLGTWTSPADFGRAARGKYTPEWWHRNVNQYGLLKTIRIDTSGTYMDGERMSDITLADIKLSEPFWTLRFTVDEESPNVGGLTIYGAGFGNHDQDIVIRVLG
ncbi:MULTISPECIES: transcriptional regulator [unclassified Paenibacillus]|uniref:ArsR/SmtB family transcription factor n=1 Tax=unclassified Paenibacillus TaxID=185978 RepID=UPI000CFBA49D|nr:MULTISPECIES: ArsR family transcriptional regulator [unclassified Paenibacillus]MBD8839034.1 ArsR family transcriptional regulator [Paenibacillus sp. CFBP 13594]PRA00661.1 transcriptional regulator [Paenibacillus sp. MYb63]PRA49803.1 transcriptional regulator [Paenibacillus sp. MYb67]QZN75787.1 ArsR family transcriptional regulator [Paenibacillus sp. DR312]